MRLMSKLFFSLFFPSLTFGVLAPCIVFAAAPNTFADFVKTTISNVVRNVGSPGDRRHYVTDLANYEKINAVYASYLQEPYPARETVCVKELPLGAKVEISMIAVTL